MIIAVDIPIHVWQGCYDDNWRGLITDDSFAHPAKFAPGLIKRILTYGIERGWWKRGDTLADPFGGIAGGGIMAGYAGALRVDLDALEEKLADAHRKLSELVRCIDVCGTCDCGNLSTGRDFRDALAAAKSAAAVPCPKCVETSRENSRLKDEGNTLAAKLAAAEKELAERYESDQTWLVEFAKENAKNVREWNHTDDYPVAWNCWYTAVQTVRQEIGGDSGGDDDIPTPEKAVRGVLIPLSNALYDGGIRDFKTYAVTCTGLEKLARDFCEVSAERSTLKTRVAELEKELDPNTPSLLGAFEAARADANASRGLLGEVDRAANNLISQRDIKCWCEPTSKCTGCEFKEMIARIDAHLNPPKSGAAVDSSPPVIVASTEGTASVPVAPVAAKEVAVFEKEGDFWAVMPSGKVLYLNQSSNWRESGACSDCTPEEYAKKYPTERRLTPDEARELFAKCPIDPEFLEAKP